MPITPADIVFHAASDGRVGEPLAKSAAPVWPDMSAEVNADMRSEYRRVFVHNTHPTLTLYVAKLWLEDVTKADVAVAADPTGPTAPTAKRLSVSDAEASKLEFRTPRSWRDGLPLGDLRPGQVAAVWMRRTGRNVAATREGYGWVVQGETLER